MKFVTGYNYPESQNVYIATPIPDGRSLIIAPQQYLDALKQELYALPLYPVAIVHMPAGRRTQNFERLTPNSIVPLHHEFRI